MPRFEEASDDAVYRPVISYCLDSNFTENPP